MTTLSQYTAQVLLCPGTPARTHRPPYDCPPHPAALLRSVTNLHQLSLAGGAAWVRVFSSAVRLKATQRQPLAHNL